MVHSFKVWLLLKRNGMSHYWGFASASKTCGNGIDTNAVSCSRCGKPVPKKTEGIMQSTTTPVSQPKPTEPQNDINNMRSNIVVTVILTVLSCSCCFVCMPIPALIGIASIIFAVQAHLKLNKGDMSGAAKVKLISDILIMIGFGLCILGWLFLGVSHYYAARHHPNNGNLSTYTRQ